MGNSSGRENLDGVKARKRAFTLIELLVVIAIIAILAAVLLPVLISAQAAGQRTYCLNNLHQIQLGWVMYYNDNSGNFPYNVPGTDTNINWVANNEDYTGGSADTNSALLVDSHHSQLAPYDQNPASYKCPVDQSKNDGLSGYPRVRSYSMSQAIGGTANGTIYDPTSGKAVAGAWLGAIGNNEQSPSLANTPGNWTVYLKDNMMHGALGPADLWVLIEEHPDSINDSAFASEQVNSKGVTVFVDVPSNIHKTTCPFSFADGHAEMHTWRNPGVIPPISYNHSIAGSGASGTGGGSVHSFPNDVDIYWMANHTSAIYK